MTDWNDLQKFARENPDIDWPRYRVDAAYREQVLRVICQTEAGRAEIFRAALSWYRRGGDPAERGEYSPPAPQEASAATIARAGALALWRGVSWVVRQAISHPVATAGVVLAVDAAVSYWRGREPEAARLYQAGRELVLGAAAGAAQAARAAGGIAQQVSRWFPALMVGAGLYLIYASRRK